MSKVIEDAAKEAAGAIKKIRAGKGNVKGNFYYAGDSRGKSAGLVVTLQARDPKGAKATTQGKAVRKEIKGAKFARGIVSLEGSSLLFELFAGSASKDHVKLGFKKKLSEYGGLAILKKAMLKKGGTEEAAEVASEEALTEEQQAEIDAILTGIDEEELAELRAAQKDLGTLNDDMAAFLSDDDLQEEIGEQIAEQLQVITSLSEATPRDDKAIDAARRALAELAYTGPEPLPEPGTMLSPEMREILTGAIDKAVTALSSFLSRAIGELKKIHDKLESASPEEVAAIEDGDRKEMLGSIDLSAAAVLSYREQLRSNLVAEAGPRRQQG